MNEVQRHRKEEFLCGNGLILPTDDVAEEQVTDGCIITPYEQI